MSVAAPLQRAVSGPQGSGVSHSRVLLQRSCVCERSTAEPEEKCDDCQTQALQPNLVVGTTDDPLEREADEVADQVVSPGKGRGPTPTAPRIQRAPSLQSGGRALASSSVERALSDPGAPLDQGTRHSMQRRFGHDFSRVRIHAGAAAERSANELAARAYTVGHDIVFGTGQFAPGSAMGRRLLAHELTHVVQQSGPAGGPTQGVTLRRKTTIGELPQPGEVDFDALADQVFEAIDGLGTDEEAVYRALQQLRRDPGMIATLTERYARRHKNADMVADIEDDFSGTELEYALQLIGRGHAGSDQRVQGGAGATTDLTTAANRLRKAMKGLGTDEEAVYATLLPFNRSTTELETTYNFLFGETLRHEIIDEMSGSELKYALSLLSFEPDSFLTEHFKEAQRPFARKIMNDLRAVKGDRLDFADDAEFAVEISKRMRTSELMQESQVNSAFAYPESCTQEDCPGQCVGHGTQGQPGYIPPDINFNAHVNKAARSYWAPAPPSQLYSFVLTPEGLENPYRALVTLFERQSSVCDMTLIHCDYLTTVIHLRAFAESIGTEVFDKRVKSGAITMHLSYYGFDNVLMPSTAGTPDPGLARGPEAVSLQSVRPASEDDLVIGDHVVFWNHLAYDALTYSPQWSGPWRLENALLVDQDDSGENLYLGHGAPTTTQGQVAKGGKRAVLKDMVSAYDGPALAALAATQRVEQGEMGAQTKLALEFPRVVRSLSGGGWLVMELEDRDENKQRPQRSHPLKRLSGPDDPDLIGLRDPTDPSKMGWVKRPIESAPGRSPSQPKAS